MRIPLVLSVLVVIAVAASASPSVITLPSGAKITGTVETNVAGNDVHAFRGIPYAEAPVGERRWKQTKLKPVTGDVDATKYGNMCYYTDTYVPLLLKLPPSEDCLFLNVFKPADAARDSKLPVMVWIHGGAFVSGASNTEEGTNLVAATKDNVIVVSFSYRLGVFGFMSNAKILSEGDGANFGLRDQEVAFQWVKQHIEFFGGDPEHITAFGESAGAMSVAMHMLSREGNQQHFKRGILESGTHLLSHHMSTPEEQERRVLDIARGVGCGELENILECLRHADSSAIFNAGGALWWMPTVDGVFLKEIPMQRVLAGKISRVPTIIGTNTDEGWIFGVPEASQHEAFVRNLFPRLTAREYERINDLYPASAFENAQHRSGEIFGDITFVCPSEFFSNKLAELNVLEAEVCVEGTCPSKQLSALVPTYHYRFNHVSTEFPRAVHGKEIAYVFNQVRFLSSDEETKTVVDFIQHYWTTFATTGSPNGNGPIEGSRTIEWPHYDAAKKQLLIQPELAIETNSKYLAGHVERCAFWNEVEKRIIQEVKFF